MGNDYSWWSFEKKAQDNEPFLLKVIKRLFCYSLRGCLLSIAFCFSEWPSTSLKMLFSTTRATILVFFFFRKVLRHGWRLKKRTLQGIINRIICRKGDLLLTAEVEGWGLIFLMGRSTEVQVFRMGDGRIRGEVIVNTQDRCLSIALDQDGVPLIIIHVHVDIQRLSVAAQIEEKTQFPFD